MNNMTNINIDIQKEDNVKKIKFKEILENCRKVQNLEISFEDFQSWADMIYFKTYLPITEKVNIIIRIFFNEIFSEELELKLIQLELYKFYNILLKYTNIECDEDDKTIENYDICYSILGDWILSICGIDYNRTTELMRNYMDYNNLDSLTTIYQKLQNTSFDKYVKEQSKMLNYIKKNPESLKDIADIAKYTNPELKKVVDIISDEAVKNTNVIQNVVEKQKKNRTSKKK